jgi:hypothetical protein
LVIGGNAMNANLSVIYSGSGNYTEERRALQKSISINEVADRIKKKKQAKQR